jgi:hypothetical protein
MPEAVELARGVADGDESGETVARLENALVALMPLPTALDDLLEATTLYNRYGPPPFLTHAEMLRAIRESGILDRIVGQPHDVLDLDALAPRISLELGRIAQGGVTVGELTWRDREEAWPKTITSDRAAVWTPESLGFTLSRDTGQESRPDLFEMVIWARGWADVQYIRDVDVSHACPEFEGVEGAIAAVRDVIEESLSGDGESSATQP